MRILLLYCSLVVFAVQAMKAPYPSSPAMRIKGRALNGTTSVLMVFQGYCKRAGLDGEDKKTVWEELQKELLKLNRAFDKEDIESIHVYLDNFEGVIPSDGLTEESLISKLNKYNPKITTVMKFLKEYNFDQLDCTQETIRSMVIQKLKEERPSWENANFHTILVYLKRAEEEVYADGITETDLTDKIKECCSEYRSGQCVMSLDPRLSKLGKPQHLVWRGT